MAKVSAGRTGPQSIEHLARWTLETDAAYRSAAAVAQARYLVLDSIGCALAAAQVPTAARTVGEVMLDQGGAPQCSIIGTRTRTSLLNAVFINGVSVRTLDLNDVVFIQKDGKLSVGGHPSDNIPVALSAGEWADASLGDVLTAVTVGYELFGRLRDVMPFSSLWDGTSASGLVSAAMVGRLMRLDPVRQAHALALASTRCSTPKVVRWGHLSSVKNMANALIAQSGTQATLLAARGLTGPLEVLDHAGGLRQVFDPELNLASLWGPAPDAPFLLKSNIKTYPCIGTAQALVAAALAASPRVRDRMGDITRIVVTQAKLPMIVNQQAEENRRIPITREDADHSFTYLPVAAMADGELTERQFENQRWLEPKMRALVEKVELTTSSELAARAPEDMPAAVEVHFRDGDPVVSECLYPPGHSDPKRGLNRDVVVKKFLEFTHSALSQAAAERVIAAVLDAPEASPVRDVFKTLDQALA